ncbi:hypothetical protein Ddye_021707 [Dipteronia dyeriana]|uniref:Glycosyltransferase n=1 Tax=Dipteronia dyeriana TaxID=168575 RepID=A0AAD9U2Q0_9ROSI|nr:hypothetical protein Ddye_021707 [Dipteronia dyeriana]
MSQGHIRPLLDISKALSNLGVKISIITTPSNAPSIIPHIGKHPQIHLVEITFPSINGLPEGCWTVDACHEFDIPRLVFHGMGALSMAISKSVRRKKLRHLVISESEAIHFGLALYGAGQRGSDVPDILLWKVPKNCPNIAKREIQEYMIKKQDKEGRNLALAPDDYDSGFVDEYDDDVLGTLSLGSFSQKKKPMASGNASSTGATVGPYKRPKQKGPLDVLPRYLNQSEKFVWWMVRESLPWVKYTRLWMEQKKQLQDRLSRMKKDINRALRRRYEMHDTIDPIYLTNINDNNEWLIGKFDNENEGDDELVFKEEDGLTWIVVAIAIGVGVPSYRTRQSLRRDSLSRTPRSSLRFIDQKDNDEEKCEVKDEGDIIREVEA